VDTQIRALPSHCFTLCNVLETVTLPSCLERIGDCAFYACRRLTKIDLGRSEVRVLPTCCFDSCVRLAVVVLPPNLESIGIGAFCNCASLVGLRFPATLKTIGPHALSYTGLRAADFRECRELAQIGAHAFDSCKTLDLVHFAAKLQSCGDCAFRKCPGRALPDFSVCRNLAQTGRSTQLDKDCSGLRKLQVGPAVSVTASARATRAALELASTSMSATVPVGLAKKARVTSTARISSRENCHH
jgi:hypothetical protein